MLFNLILYKVIILHTVRCINLRCKVERIFTYVYTYVTTTQIKIQNISSTQKVPLCQLNFVGSRALFQWKHTEYTLLYLASFTHRFVCEIYPYYFGQKQSILLIAVQNSIVLSIRTSYQFYHRWTFGVYSSLELL